MRRTENAGCTAPRDNRRDKHLDRSLLAQQLAGDLTAASERRPSVGGKLSREEISHGAEMEISGPEQEVAMGEVCIALQAGHCSLFKGRRQPKTWTPRAAFVPPPHCGLTDLQNDHCFSDCPTGPPTLAQQRIRAALLTCLGVCETLPGCHRAASLPGEPHLTGSFQPPALPASVTTGWREQTKCNSERQK